MHRRIFWSSGVKTTRRWRHKNGAVSARQIDRVAARLQQATPEQLRIVVVHQPVAVQQAKDAHDRLRNCDRALERWAAAGCDLVLGGHIHLPYVIELPNFVRPIWAVQAGTALSSRVRGGIPNSVNLLRWGALGAAPQPLFDRALGLFRHRQGVRAHQQHRREPGRIEPVK